MNQYVETMYRVYMNTKDKPAKKQELVLLTDKPVKGSKDEQRRTDSRNHR